MNRRWSLWQIGSVWSVILAVDPDSRPRTLGCNESFNNERQGRADGHHEHNAIEHVRIDEAVEVASGDEPVSYTHLTLPTSELV